MMQLQPILSFFYVCILLKELKLREKFSNSALFFQAEFHLKGEYNPALKKKKKNKKKKAGKGQEKYVMTAIVLILWRSICQRFFLKLHSYILELKLHQTMSWLSVVFFSLSSKVQMCASPSLLGEASNLEFDGSIISTKIDSVTDYLMLQCGHSVFSLINTRTVVKESTLQFMLNPNSRKQWLWKPLNQSFEQRSNQFNLNSIFSSIQI